MIGLMALAFMVSFRKVLWPVSNLSPATRAAVLAATCQPIFTKDGQPSRSGTAFLLRDDLGGSAPLLFTAHHLFGLATAHDAGMAWTQTPRRVTAASCETLDRAATVHAGHAIAIVGAHALWALDDIKDVAALKPVGHIPPPLHLRNHEVKLGERVWLIARTQNPLNWGLVHPGTVEEVSANSFFFRYDNPTILLSNTSGGPVVDIDGRVVGLNIGGARSKHGDRLGLADTTVAMRAALIDASATP